jgi:septal ring factor EnvC (AmiA/AmiB activator)
MVNPNTVYRLRRIFATALIAVWLTGPGPAFGADDEDVDAQRRKLEAVRKQIERTQDALEDKRRTRDRVDDQLQALELKVQDRHKALREVQARLTAKRDRLERLRGRRDTLRQKLALHHDRLAGQLRAAYFSGGQEHLKLLLNQQDPAALARTLKYYEYLNEARVETIDRAEATLVELDETEQTIARENAELERLGEQREAEYRQLVEARTERKTLMKELSDQIASHRRSVETLREDENRLRELIGRLTGLFADIPSEAGAGRAFAKRRGELPWPVSGRFLNSFGEPRPGSDLVWHGIRIAAPGGQDVRAVSHGRIAFADWLPNFGLVLIIDHNDGYMSLYAHNEALYKDTGDWVNPGEVVASVGNSGGRRRSALYFEIRHNGKPVDPAQWCRNRQSG